MRNVAHKIASASEFANANGWDYSCVKATAEKGVSDVCASYGGS